MALIPEGYKQTEVGVIPEDWGLPLLDSIANRGSGHTPDKKHPEYWNGPIKWVSLRDSDALDKLFIEETAATVTAAGIANSSAVIHPAGTVVLSRDAGVGKSAIIKTEMAVSQHFMAWQCGANLDNIYLYYWLQAAKPEFERIAMGNTIKTIGLPFFRNLRIAQPPLPEQRAIAAALLDVDALLAKLDQLIAKKRDLKQAAMQQFLTGQTRLPGFSGAWDVKRLGDVVEIRKGQLITEKDSIEGEVPVIAGGKKPSYFHNSANRFGKTITVSASGANAGYVAFYDVPIFASDCSTISENLLYSIEFIYFQLLLKQNLIYKAQTGGAQPHIHAVDLIPLEIGVCSVKEQTAIATVLSDMDAEIAALEARRDKTRALKQGMMQELLTGRIRLV